MVRSQSPQFQDPFVLVLTGAGISADSGIATFRDAGGLWEGHRIEDVATPEAWERNPRLVWRFYQLRRAQLREVAPNAAHLALARFEQACASAGVGFELVTQNVDDLHDRAGSRTWHMHGELTQIRCERCTAVVRGLAELDPESLLSCRKCGFPRMRPDIVWFGEVPYHLERIERSLSRCTHFVSIGTSGVVYPAAGFLSAARSRGAATIVNSLDEPANLHPRDRFVPGRASDVVPALLAGLAREVGIGDL